VPTLCKDPSLAANYHPISLLSLCYKLLERLALHRISPTVEGYSIQFKVAVLTYKVLHGCALSYLGPFVRVADLPSRRALRSANTSRHSPTGPPLATEPFLLLVPKSGTVCHRRSHQHHHWTPFVGIWRLICSPCHIRTYNYRNWLTSVSGPCSNFLLRPL